VASIRFEVDTREVSKLSAWVAGLQNQLPYAASRALNDTTRQAAADLNRSTGKTLSETCLLTCARGCRPTTALGTRSGARWPL